MADLRLAENMSRLGTETAFEVLARAAALAAQGRDIINLGIGQPDFKTPPHIVEAAVKALRDGHHGYTPANGILALREAVAADIRAAPRRRGRAPTDVLIVPGGKVTMFFAILMFGEPGAEIMYPNPGFPIYESVINFSGAKPVPMHAQARRTSFAFTADERAGADHAAHPADHPQQPGQSDRRRRAAGRDRQAGRRPRAPPAGRDHQRRDLRPPRLRRPRACLAAELPGDPRPR